MRVMISPQLCHLCYFIFLKCCKPSWGGYLIVSYLTTWYLIVILVCLSQMTNYIGHHSCAFSYFYIFFKNYHFKCLPIFKIGLFVFLLLKWKRHLYILKSSLKYFYFLDGVLWRIKLFHFDEVQLIPFLSLILLLSYIRNHCMIQGHNNIPLCFSLRITQF